MPDFISRSGDVAFHNNNNRHRLLRDDVPIQREKTRTPITWQVDGIRLYPLIVQHRNSVFRSTAVILFIPRSSRCFFIFRSHHDPYRHDRAVSFSPAMSSQLRQNFRYNTFRLRGQRKSKFKNTHPHTPSHTYTRSCDNWRKYVYNIKTYGGRLLLVAINSSSPLKPQPSHRRRRRPTITTMARAIARVYIITGNIHTPNMDMCQRLGHWNNMFCYKSSLVAHEREWDLTRKKNEIKLFAFSKSK